MKMTENTLILQNEREKMLAKLQDLQVNNLTAKQQEKLSKTRSGFVYEFSELSYSFYGLSTKQLATFSEKELKELADFISRKARPWAICQMLFTFGVPVIGWAFGPMIGINEGEFQSWLYLRRRRCLKKMCGKEYFPYETVKKWLIK